MVEAGKPDDVLSKLNDLASKKKQLEQHREKYTEMQASYKQQLEEVRQGMWSYPHLLGLLEQYTMPESLEARVSAPSLQQTNARKLIAPYVLQAIDGVSGGLTQQQIFEMLKDRFTPAEISNALNNTRVFLAADEHGKYTVTDRGRSYYVRSVENAERRAQIIQFETQAWEDSGHVNIRNAVLRTIKEHPGLHLEQLVGKLPDFTRSQVYDAEYALFEAKLVGINNGALSVTEAGEQRLAKPAHGDLRAKIHKFATSENHKERAITASEIEKALDVSSAHARKVLISDGWQVAFGKYFVPGSWVGDGVPEESLLKAAVKTGKSIPNIEQHLRRIGINISTDTVRKYLKTFGLVPESQKASKSSAQQVNSGVAAAISELPRDRAASGLELARTYKVSAIHANRILHSTGWKNVFANIYVHRDAFGEDARKAMMQKAFEGGKTLAGAQEFLKSIGIDVHKYVIADLASEFKLMDLEEAVKSAAKEIGIDYDSQTNLPSPQVVIQAMHALSKAGKKEFTTDDLKLILPAAHRKRKDYILYNFVKDGLVERTDEATYRLTKAGEDFFSKTKRARSEPYELVLPISVRGEEILSADLYATSGEGAGLENALAGIAVETRVSRSIKVPAKFDLGTTILYVMQKAKMNLPQDYLAQVLSQKYENGEVLSEIENLKASGAIGVDEAGKLIVMKSGRQLLESKFRRPASVTKVKAEQEPEALETILEKGTSGLPLTEFDKEVFAGIDNSSMQLMYLLYANDMQTKDSITRAQIKEHFPGTKYDSAEVTLYRLRKGGKVISEKSGTYKLTDDGRKFLQQIFNERYVHELAGKPLELPQSEKNITKQLSGLAKAEYAVLLLGRESSSFSRTDVRRMFDNTDSAVNRAVQMLIRDSFMAYVEGTKLQHIMLTEAGIKALEEKFAKLKAGPATPAPQLPAAQNVPSLLEGFGTVPPFPVATSAQPSGIPPAAAAQQQATSAEAKSQGPTPEKRKAVADKITRFWHDHRVPVSETLVGQIMNGESIEPFLGEGVAQRKIGGKIVFVPSDMSDAAFERWRTFYSIAANAENKGQPVIIEDAAIQLHTDTDVIRAMAHGLKKSGLVSNEIPFKQTEKISVRDPETIRNRAGMCLRFGGMHAITTTDLINMTGLPAESLLARSSVVTDAVIDLIKKIFPQDGEKINIAFDKGKGGKNPVIIVSRKE